MLRTMVYGDSQTAGTANYILETDATPPQRCISKDVAITLGSSKTALDQWEHSQKKYGNQVPFPRRRLIPAASVTKDANPGPSAELYDDRLLVVEYDRATVKYDSFMAGYSYVVTDILFNDSASQTLYGSSSISTSEGSDDVIGDYVEYAKGWARVRVTKPSDYPENAAGYGDAWDDTYHHINVVGYSDFEGGSLYTNTGADRSITVSFTATPVQSMPAGVNYVSQDKTHTQFKTVFYHKGQNTSSTIWKQYNINSTNSITLSHTKSANSSLDIAVTVEGASTNGTYWDSTGWIRPSSLQSSLSSAISITKNQNGTNLVIDCSVIRNFAHWIIDNSTTGHVADGYNATSVPIYVYGCWETMTSGGTSDGHLVGNYEGVTTVSASGMTSQNITIKSAGNLNKTDESQSVTRYYTPIYKIYWDTDQLTIDVMELDPWDVASMQKLENNIGGTYGLVYPTSGFVRSTSSGSLSRNYVGDTSVINNNQATITIASTINGQPAAYTISQYFPYQSETYTETYTINGQSLNGSNSITITPNAGTSTLTINFGNINPTSARWLTLQLVDSREYANISFTFNE